MSYVSIDLETTGLDPDYCQVLEFGAVLDDWKSPLDELPVFHRYIAHDRIQGEPRGLRMNRDILDRITGGSVNCCKPDQLAGHFIAWLSSNGIRDKVVAAGKNFGSFDLQFLKRLPGFANLFHHRSLDPGSMYWKPTDAGILCTEAYKLRAGLDGGVAHTAVADAMDVIRLIRVHHRCPAGIGGGVTQA